MVYNQVSNYLSTSEKTSLDVQRFFKRDQISSLILYMMAKFRGV